MKDLLMKIRKHLRDLRSFHKSLYFNFHYLPFRQAIHVPILLYKPKFLSLKGSIKLVGGGKYGMIKLGYPTVSIYPNSGITIENKGGTIIFNGKCNIGNNSYISIGKKGFCEIGTRVEATATFRLICYHNIYIGNKCSFGWDCMILDTDFHRMKKLNGGYSKGYAPIYIGDSNWFGNGCLILKRTKTPNHCVISARSVLSSNIEAPEYSLIEQKRETIVKTTGLWRDIEDSAIIYD